MIETRTITTRRLGTLLGQALLTWAACLLILGRAGASAAELDAPRRPNVLLLVADDQPSNPYYRA